MGLIIHQERVTPELGEKLEKICPFGAISYDRGKINVGMSCKLCKLCVKNGNGAVEYEEDAVPSVDKTKWNGIAVFCEHFHGTIHPITLELLGKAKELASVTGHKIAVLMIGNNITEASRLLFGYGADEVYVYDNPALENFLIEPYTNVFEDFIQKICPSSILVGATNVGRSLAPRVAARIGTGLTADCTALKMTKETDLVQIRPAFGGNIMAEIMTPNHRPQFCTVRYKIFSKPKQIKVDGIPTIMQVTEKMLHSNARILDIEVKPGDIDISEADSIVLVGRGIKNKGDLEMLQQLADRLGAKMACTRPLVENGWFDVKRQIGLSGRTVKPKLLIAAGVSGAVQTIAGLKEANVLLQSIKIQKLQYSMWHTMDLWEIYTRLFPHFLKGCENNGE